MKAFFTFGAAAPVAAAGGHGKRVLNARVFVAEHYHWHLRLRPYLLHVRVPNQTRYRWRSMSASRLSPVYVPEVFGP